MIFESFKTSKQFVEKTKFVKIYKFIYANVEYKIIITKRFANKHTNIHCIDNYIAWEQVPRFPRASGRWHGDKIPVYKFNEDKKNVVIFVIKGKPNGITGLDDGIFRCANNFDNRHMNVMSYNRFRKL